MRHAFVWSVLVLMVFNALAGVVALRKQDFGQEPTGIVIDIMIAIGYIAWAAWLLGKHDET